MLIVEKSSPLHSVQDAGRFGYARLGISQAGPADWKSWAWANWLTHNAYGAGVLELPGGGFVGRFTRACSIGITGGLADVFIDGVGVPQNTTLNINTDQRLEISGLRSGNFVYLAIKGGVTVTPCYASRSRSIRDELGDTISPGAALPYPVGKEHLRPLQRQVPRQFLPSFNSPLSVSLMLGSQIDQFDLEAVLQNHYEVTAQADRMGIRLRANRPLRGQPLQRSEPIALGAVQVPPDGHPIVLGRDRQSIGGYPKLGTVTREALGEISQRRAGCPLAFHVVDRPQVLRRAAQLNTFFGGFD